MRRPLGLAVILAVSWMPGGGSLSAQVGQDCEWLPPSGTFVRQQIGNSAITRVTTPHLRCPDGVRLRADSARYFEATSFYQLFGNVSYDDPERAMTGDLARYWEQDGRLEGRGAVRLERKTDGSVITGEELDYREATQSLPYLLTVRGGRPHATLYLHPRTEPPPRAVDSVGPPLPPDTAAVPYDVDADEIRIFGEDQFYGIGNVEVRRDSMDAYGEYMEFSRGEGTDLFVLREDARMVTPRYELTGDSIRTDMVGNELTDLVSRGRAVLTGEDIRLAAPVVRIYLDGGGMERLVAVRDTAAADPPEADTVAPDPLEMEHPPRPVARAEGFVLVADSLEVQAPGEVLESLVAVGRARGESTARDSLNTADTPPIARRDWIEGETVVASFTRVETPDTAAGAPEGEVRGDRGEYRLDSLVARVSARSLYRMAPGDTVAGNGGGPPPEGTRLAIHYVTGDVITIVLSEGAISRMDVEGMTRGMHLEPGSSRTGGPGPASRGGPAEVDRREGDGRSRPDDDGAGGGRPDEAGETGDPWEERR